MKKTLLLGVASLMMSMGFAQVDCDIANMQGTYAGGFLNWIPGGDGLYTLIDPADDLGIAQSCGATYPYTINTVEFSLADASAFGAGTGIGTFEYQVGIYALTGADPCNPPGSLIGSSPVISVNLAGAGLNPQSIDLDIDVNDAFFISFEPVSWSGPATEVPSILWDDVARPLCVQQLFDSGTAEWVDFTDFFAEGDTGWAEWIIFGTSQTGGGEECDAGMIADTNPVSICPNETAEFSTGGSEVIPVGDSYSVHFVPNGGTGGPGGDFFLTGVVSPYTFDSDLNGVLSGANPALPPLEGVWELYGAVIEDVNDPENTICEETTEFLEVTFLASDDPACESTGGDECLDWVDPTPTTGYNDFNTEFGGAPCNDGTGCPFNEIDAFEVWISEAYELDNCVTGGSYTFSHCNGPGAGSWIPEYTIIAPSGAVDAFGAGDGDGCSITWTASEDGTYFIVINEAGNCGGPAADIDNGFPAITCNGTPDCGPPVECDAGEITDTTPVAICPNETADFLTGGSQSVPVGNTFCIHFVPTTGTGGPDADFYLTGVTTPYNFDNDLNGVLSGVPVPVLEGEWELYGAVVEDPLDAANTVCSETTEFLLVDFLTSNDPACGGAGGDECTDWVNPTPTGGWSDLNDEFGGAPCNDGTGCPFNELDAFEVWESEAYALDNCVTGGSYTFSHCNGPGAGSWIPEYTIIAPSGAIDAFGAGDGDGCSITWTATEDGTYLIVVNEAGACGVEGTTDNGFPAITCNGTPPCESGGDECTDWVNPTPTGGWSDLNDEFGGAPCNDGTGCPFNELDAFEVWESEAYALDNCVTGGSYTFSHCNGPGAGSWVPEYTIIAPSGAIDASGSGDGDGCSITWTATENGTYLIVINEAGACGVEGTTDNGFPAITCNGTPPCPGAPANDDCANAEGISPGIHDFTTVSATTDGPDQPGSDCDAFDESNIAQDVWYEYTASCNGTGIMSTCNTANFDTRIAVYPAGTCPPDGSTLIACNDDGFDDEGTECDGFTSVLEWDIEEGETYLLRLGGFADTFSGSGTFELIEDCITSVDDQEASFSVFPNPNNGQFALEFAGDNGIAQIDVLDVSGKSVHSEQRMMTSGSRMDIDLGNVSGMYFVRMTMNDNVQMLKVIVQ